MTKSELKTGYVVRYRNGSLRMVMPMDDGIALVQVNGEDHLWASPKDFNEDLTCKHSKMSELDIVEVYGCSASPRYVFEFKEHDRKLLWKRKEKKKYTYAQLREILGEEFEVV